ncbi:MAG: hypothetical protein JNG90_00040 [Planctomycetaceae bacterium]|nr:hypothetical protein [Planctomycetaceae bacterium]
MLRTKVGILAIVLLATAVLLPLAPQAGDDTALWAAACQRVGFVLAVLWLALPELQRMSPWYAVATIGVLFVLARFPRYLVAAVVVAILFLFLRPRMNSPGSRGRRAG